MEIFLPSLIIILLVAFFAFLVLPRMGPMVLTVVALIALIAAGIHHYSLFYSEYKLSTWQNGLSAYTPWIVLGFALIFIMTSIMFLVGGPETKAAIANTVSTPMEAIQEGISNSLSSMPSANTATNPVTATLNRVINSAPAFAPASAPASAPANVKPNNKKTPNIPGLGFAASNV